MSNNAIAEKREVLVKEMENFNEHFDKFINNNAAAGTRARKSLMLIGKLSKELRADIQEIKNNK